MARPARFPNIPSAIERHGRMLLLAYDQGMEHGPAEFTDETVDPGYVLDIADHGPFTGVVLQKGIARAYYRADRHAVPLVLKLNGKTDLVRDQDPYAPLVCTVEEAVELGAKAVAYTLYLGSAFEGKMLAEFAQVVRDAHEQKLPVIAWMTPRGHNIDDETDGDILAYAARVALELGADYAMLRYGGDAEGYAWAVESAGRCKVVALGSTYLHRDEAVELAKTCVGAGAVGMVAGRCVWQSTDPLAVSKALGDAVFGRRQAGHMAAA